MCRSSYDLTQRAILNFTFNRVTHRTLPGKRQSLRKVKTLIVPPPVLALAPAEERFHLLAVVFFTGNHYYCLLRSGYMHNSDIDGPWMYCNDDTVICETLELSSEQTHCARICQLIYMRDALS